MNPNIPISLIAGQSRWQRLKNYFWSNNGWVTRIPKNTSENMIELIQDDGQCSVYACVGSIMYNTPLIISQNEIDDIVKILGPSSARTFEETVKYLCLRYHLTYAMFSSPFEPQACKVLDNGYSLACSVHFSKEMYADGIKDGKIDTVYENNIRMHHIIQLLKKGKDFYLHNSWGQYIPQGYHNTYRVDMDIIKKNNLMPRECFLIV